MLVQLCKGHVYDDTFEIAHPYAGIIRIRFIGYNLSPMRGAPLQ